MCKIFSKVPNETPEQLLIKKTFNTRILLFPLIFKKNNHALFSVQEQLLRDISKM